MSNHDSMGNKDHRRHKDGSTGSGSSGNTYSAFRQWRRSTSIGSNNRSNSTGSRSSNSLAKLPNDPATIRKLEQFPLGVLSDATMPDEDLSLKFLALVRTRVSHVFFLIRRLFVRVEEGPLRGDLRCYRMLWI